MRAHFSAHPPEAKYDSLPQQAAYLVPNSMKQSRTMILTTPSVRVAAERTAIDRLQFSSCRKIRSNVSKVRV